MSNHKKKKLEGPPEFDYILQAMQDEGFKLPMLNARANRNALARALLQAANDGNIRILVLPA